MRWNGRLGDFTYLFNQKGVQYGVRTGDVISASMVGDVITAFENGLQMAQVRDTTFVAGNPGLGLSLDAARPGCAETNATHGFTSFMATDYLPGSPGRAR